MANTHQPKWIAVHKDHKRLLEIYKVRSYKEKKTKHKQKTVQKNKNLQLESIQKTSKKIVQQKRSL